MRAALCLLSCPTAPGAPPLRPLTPCAPQETVSATVRAALFMLFNTALGSYIVGTITLLVVRCGLRWRQSRRGSGAGGPPMRRSLL